MPGHAIHAYAGDSHGLLVAAAGTIFVRVDPLAPPGKSALQSAVGAVSAQTWERVNRCLLKAAWEAGVESGERVRVDSTVTETHILAPSDIRLLYDGVRVLSGLLREAREKLGGETVRFVDRCRSAKRCHLRIRTERGQDKRAGLYRKLLRMAVDTLDCLDAARSAVAAMEEKWAIVNRLAAIQAGSNLSQ